jgi:hypothetical protein
MDEMIPKLEGMIQGMKSSSTCPLDRYLPIYSTPIFTNKALPNVHIYLLEIFFNSRTLIMIK